MGHAPKGEPYSFFATWLGAFGVPAFRVPIFFSVLLVNRLVMGMTPPPENATRLHSCLLQGKI